MILRLSLKQQKRHSLDRLNAINDFFLKKKEDAAICRAIGGVAERIFLPMKEIILQGSITRSTDICEQSQCAFGESVKQFGDCVGIAEDNTIISSDLERQNEPLAPHHGGISKATADTRAPCQLCPSTRMVDLVTLALYKSTMYAEEDPQLDKSPNAKAYRALRLDKEACEKGLPSPKLMKGNGHFNFGNIFRK